MSKNELKKVKNEIHNNAKKICSNIRLPEEEIKYFKDLFLKFDLKLDKDFINLPIEDFILSTLTLSHNTLPFNKLKENIKKILPLYNNPRSNTFKKNYDLFYDLSVLSELGILEEIKDGTIEKKINKLNKIKKEKSNEILTVECDDTTTEIDLDKIIDSISSSYEKCFKYFSDNDKTTKFNALIDIFLHSKTPGFLSLALNFAEIKSEFPDLIKKPLQTDFKILSKQTLWNSSILNATQDEALEDLKFSLESSNLNQVQNLLIGYYIDLDREQTKLKTIKDDIKAKETALCNLIDSFNKNIENNQEISFDKLNDNISLLCVFGAEFGIKILNIISKNQIKDLKDTIDKFQSYGDTKANSIALIFSQTPFTLEKISQRDLKKLVRNANLDTLKDTLNILSKSVFKDIDFKDSRSIDLILNVTKTTLPEIEYYIQSDIINKNFILNNPDICKEETIENLRNNVDSLVTTKINIRNIKYEHSNIFNLDNEILNNNITMSKNYNLNYFEYNNTNFSFLEDAKNYDIVDSFIELGLEDFIANNPQYITEDSNTIIKRIICAQMINTPILNNNKLNSTIRRSNEFIVKDNQLEEFIPHYVEKITDPETIMKLKNTNRNIISEEIKNNPLVKELEKYETTPNTYTFGNTIISKNKVLRNLEVFKETLGTDKEQDQHILFNSILYNSKLNENKVKPIQEMINSLDKDNKIYKK